MSHYVVVEVVVILVVEDLTAQVVVEVVVLEVKVVFQRRLPSPEIMLLILEGVAEVVVVVLLRRLVLWRHLEMEAMEDPD